MREYSLSTATLSNDDGIMAFSNFVLTHDHMGLKFQNATPPRAFIRSYAKFDSQEGI